MTQCRYILLLLFLGLRISFAQEITTDFKKKVKIERYTGIKYTNVNSIVVDNANVKWVGTIDSVVQVNSFLDFDLEVTKPGVYAIGKGKNDRVWLALKSNIIFDVATQKSYPLNLHISSSINHLEVTDNFVFISSTDGLYILTINNTKLNDEVRSIEKISRESGLGNVLKTKLDSDNKLWIVCADGIYRMDDKKRVKRLEDLHITAASFNDKSLYCVSDGKLHKYEDMIKLKEISQLEDFPEYRIEDLCFDHKGNLWLAGNFLSVYLEGSTKKIDFGPGEGFTSKHGLHMAIDKENILWVGTEGKGLYRVEIEEEKHVIVTEMEQRYDFMKGYATNNIVLLLDFSNSMNAPYKLPKVKESMKVLTSKMRPEDKISVIIFSKNARIVLPPTACTNLDQFNEMLDTLQVSGGSNIYSGLSSAYKTLNYNYDLSQNNRIILATDGAYQVDDNIMKLISSYQQPNIYLSVIDFSQAANSSKLKSLAKAGRGEYYNITGNSSDVYDALETEIKARKRILD